MFQSGWTLLSNEKDAITGGDRSRSRGVRVGRDRRGLGVVGGFWGGRGDWRDAVWKAVVRACKRPRERIPSF